MPRWFQHALLAARPDAVALWPAIANEARTGVLPRERVAAPFRRVFAAGVSPGLTYLCRALIVVAVSLTALSAAPPDDDTPLAPCSRTVRLSQRVAVPSIREDVLRSGASGLISSTPELAACAAAGLTLDVTANVTPATLCRNGGTRTVARSVRGPPSRPPDSLS